MNGFAIPSIADAPALQRIQCTGGDPSIGHVHGSCNTQLDLIAFNYAPKVASFL